MVWTIVDIPVDALTLAHEKNAVTTALSRENPFGRAIGNVI